MNLTVYGSLPSFISFSVPLESRAAPTIAPAMTVARASTFQARVYAVVRSVPRGNIVSYGGVAAIVGQPRAARGVGRALCALPADTDVPWWRVVNRNGEISIRGAMHGAIVQRKLLEREGVRFDRNDRIDWRIHGWSGYVSGRGHGSGAPAC